MPTPADVAAERRVLKSVTATLVEAFGEDNVEVAHSFQGLRQTADGQGLVRNEIDVVAMWTDHDGNTNLAAIEVKSWNNFSIKGQNEWYAYTNKQRLSPFEQVELAARTASEFLAEHGSLAGRKGEIRMLRIAAFPHMKREKGSGVLSAHADFQRALFKEDIDNPHRLLTFLTWAARSFHQDRVDFEATRPILRRHCFVPADPEHLRSVLKSLAEASEGGCSAQAADLTRGQKRVLVEGAAGTGKSVVAAECAVRLAQQNPGKKVVLLTYHQHLADHLGEGIQGAHPEETEHIVVGTPESVLSQLGTTLPQVLARAGTSWREDRDYLRLPAFYEAVRAQTRDSAPIGAVLVDEGQDFSSEALVAMQRLLAQDGTLMIFADPLQRTRADNSSVTWMPPQFDQVKFPFSDQPYVLNQNWRNTNSIGTWVLNEVLMRFGPERRPEHTYATLQPFRGNEPHVGVADVSDNEKDLLARLEEVLAINVENLDRVTVLCQTPEELPQSVINCVDEAGVVLRSVDSIRGLEADVVVLLGPQPSRKSKISLSSTYVGATRARGALYFLPYKFREAGASLG